MKRIIVTSLLGIAVSSIAVAPSYGQGHVMFANYNSAADAPVTYSTDPIYAPPGKAGLAVGSGFSASLYYAFGTISDPNALTLLENQPNYPTPFFGSADGDTAHGAGYFIGGEVIIPGYISGPITFEVVAWANSGQYGGTSYANSWLRGASTLFTLPSIAVGLSQPSELGPGLLPFTVGIVPEPSTFALVGLGSLALLLFRRRV